MKELIGVCSLDKIIVEDLKRYYLFFDKLHIIGAKDWLYDVHNKNALQTVRPFINQVIFMFWRDLSQKDLGEYQKYLTSELHWLVDQDKIILDDREIALKYDGSENFKLVRANSQKISNFAFDFVKKIKKDNTQAYIDTVSLFHELSLRDSNVWMNLNEECEVYPLIDKFTSIKEIESKKQIVLKNTINKIPMPRPDVAWESIFEFKNDKDSFGSLLGLKCFINEMSKSNLSLSEIDEKTEYLLYKYEKALELHKIKSSSSILEMLIVGSAELIENVAKLKFGKIAKGLFKIGKSQIELMDLELKAEGSELSYLSKIKKNFGK